MSVGEATPGGTNGRPPPQTDEEVTQAPSAVDVYNGELNAILNEPFERYTRAGVREWRADATFVITRIGDLSGSGANEAQGSDQPPSPQNTHRASDHGSGTATSNGSAPSTNDSIGGAGNGSSNGTR